MTHHIAGLFVYNPTLGHEFSEGEKILAFYPNIDFDLQKQHVGLCEGLFSFTRYVGHYFTDFQEWYNLLRFVSICHEIFFLVIHIVLPCYNL